VNRKLGGSMKTGFATATGDLVLYTDADLPFDMLEVRRAVRLLHYYEADVVSAFRFDRTGEGYMRTVYSSFITDWFEFFGVKMRDINFAFKLCRGSIFEKIELKSEGSFIDAELVIRAKKSGMSVIQFGVDYFPRTRGVSTLSSPVGHSQNCAGKCSLCVKSFEQSMPTDQFPQILMLRQAMCVGGGLLV
jgi:glycosyltransferase involved in cell wall biosynthesis